MKTSKLVLIAALLLAGIASTTSADVIYDNTSTSTGIGPAFSTSLQGDEVHAAGTARYVSLLQIGVAAQGEPVVADLQAWLYANDGAGGQPGTLLWQSPLMTAVPLSGGINLVSFTVPQVLVPDTFTWALQTSNARPSAVGLYFFNPPTVGTSADYDWFGGPNSWGRGFFPSPANPMARVTASAVPEPSAAVLAITAIGSIWILRKSRNLDGSCQVVPGTAQRPTARIQCPSVARREANAGGHNIRMLSPITSLG